MINFRLPVHTLLSSPLALSPESLARSLSLSLSLCTGNLSASDEATQSRTISNEATQSSTTLADLRRPSKLHSQASLTTDDLRRPPPNTRGARHRLHGTLPGRLGSEAGSATWEIQHRGPLKELERAHRGRGDYDNRKRRSLSLCVWLKPCIFKVVTMNSLSSFMDMVNRTLDMVTFTFEAPFARAVVFGVPIGGHLFVEGLLLVVIVFLLSQKSYKPPKRPLTKKEIDELCDEWVPESLVPPITEEMHCEPPVLERTSLLMSCTLCSAAGPHTMINGKEVVNFASANYLGFVGHEKLLESCTSSLEKYGVGSSGPRGFYGTIDVHLDCEGRIAKFLGTPDSILYPYGLSTMFSAIPAFCKKGDIIVVDEGVHWGIQNGLYLSRSTIVYFKHNDMESLQSTLEKVTFENTRAKKLRRYIVVEAIYQMEDREVGSSCIGWALGVGTWQELGIGDVCLNAMRQQGRVGKDGDVAWGGLGAKAVVAIVSGEGNSGQIAPLDEIIRLKEKYRFRVLLDESNSIGVLGSFGRGLTEHYGVAVEKIDIITAAMGHALATEGGFCTGSARVIDHQRLSSSGYVFSASLPPYLASAAITALDILEENPDLITKLKKNISVLCKGLSDVEGLEVASDALSPIVFLRLKNSTGSLKNDLQLLDEIADRALKEDSVFVVTSKRSTLDKCRLPVGIRLFVSAGHSESDLLKASGSLKRVAALVLAAHD
ncbi:hypothetical protein RHMOL_Rhmol10G0104000 [Rhododendron molle]|uniref:Uncharacterized protein n=1 Tax=Rhododendron molle TaxID=49168 RepID=A0ACC0M1H4_RHOML|nr:hypothetical protein RHMOL_Rhmol10G0104000 [Rhododendron molle]